MMRRLSMLLALIATAHTSAACSILDRNRCEPEYVGLAAFGQVGGSATSPPTLSSQVELIPASSAGVARVIWVVASESLKPHVTRAELRDAGDGTLIFAFPLETAPPWAISFGDQAYAWRLPFDDVRGRLGARRGVVELTTDLPDQPLVRLPLSSTSDRPGGQCK